LRRTYYKNCSDDSVRKIVSKLCGKSMFIVWYVDKECAIAVS
jgi:hypothetical protein